MSKVFFTVIVLSFFISRAFPQTFSTARIAATVVEPIRYTNSLDLNFASMSIIVAGSVELITKDVHTTSANITLPVTMGTFTAMSYVVSGATAYTYKISVPLNPIEVPYEGNTLIANSLDTDPMLYSESELIAGVFVSFSPKNVTVNYN